MFFRTDFAQPATYKNYAFTPEENKQPVENTTPITRGGYGVSYIKPIDKQRGIQLYKLHNRTA